MAPDTTTYTVPKFHEQGRDRYSSDGGGEEENGYLDAIDWFVKLASKRPIARSEAI